MCQEDLELEYRKEHNTSSSGSPDYVSNQFLGSHDSGGVHLRICSRESLIFFTCGSNFQERCTRQIIEGNSLVDQIILDGGGDDNYSLN
jgi:hypothetical protein